MSQTPVSGEKRTHGEVVQFWEDYSQVYTGRMQGDAPERIAKHLSKLGIIRKTDTVLEIGPGPGTYSFQLAGAVEALRCLDSSEGMLRRLRTEASDRNIGNISCIHSDWDTYDDPKSVDVCISTLCPGSGNPDFIEHMEKTSRRDCILVSWTVNHGDDLNSEIWKRLGKDYDYNIRRSTATQDWLANRGCEPSVEYFEAHVEFDIPVDQIVREQRTAFASYGVNGIEPIVMDILEDAIDGDMVHFKATNELKVISWSC